MHIVFDNRVHRSGREEGRGEMGWNGMEWDGMERNGMGWARSETWFGLLSNIKDKSNATYCVWSKTWQAVWCSGAVWN